MKYDAYLRGMNFRRSRRLHGRRGLKYAKLFSRQSATMSPPSRAAWIEIGVAVNPSSRRGGRRLHGRRGLKFRAHAAQTSARSRRLHGRRGLKSHRMRTARWCCRRRLHGRRGLKCGSAGNFCSTITSPPSRAAWIEMTTLRSGMGQSLCRRLHGRRGLKCGRVLCISRVGRSPPSRAAWIEITAQ